MPIYQYRCRNCGAEVEKMQSFTSEPLVECPECHQLTLKKVIQPAGIIFKGSGWYITDSKKSSSAVTPAGEKSDGNKSNENSTAGESSSSSASDSKSSDSKSGESKSGDSKASESKSSDSKSNDSKSSESKASAAPASTPAATSSSSS